jgi:MFS family permease
VSDERGFGRAFVALQHRDFRVLFLSNITSGMGGQLQLVANAWQVYALTGSAFHLGLTGLARGIPIIVFSLAGGVIADRWDRRKIMIGTQMLNGSFGLALAFLTFTGLVEVWQIYAVTFMNSTLTSVSIPARRAVIAGLVPRHHLVNATALNASIHQIDRIVAPSIAGILIALFGVPITYALNRMAHLITAVALWFIALVPVQGKPEGSPLRNLLDGLAFVRERSIILVLLLTDVVAMLLGSYPVLLPIIAEQYDAGPIGFGLLTSAPAMGSLVGVTAVMYIGDAPYKGRMIVGCIFAYGALLIGLALSPTFLLAMLCTAGLGLTDSMQATLRNAAIQLMTPDALRGRVSAFQHMLQGGGPALGQGIMGAAAGLLGLPLALISGGALCMAIIASMVVRRPDLRDRDLGEQAEREPIVGRSAAPVG